MTITTAKPGVRGMGGISAQWVRAATIACAAWTMLAPPVAAQTLTRVSVSTDGTPGNDASTRAVISADGRYVAFSSNANTLVTGDNNLVRDVFVHDRTTGNTVRVSVSSSGVQADAKSDRPTISVTGRFIAFYSDATNLVDLDTNLQRDVFVHDRDPDANGVFDEDNGTTTLVSVHTFGIRGNGGSNHPALSADGRYVAFRTRATNLVDGDSNAMDDILVRDLQAGTTQRVNVSSTGDQALGGNSDRPVISADGRFVAFYSDAGNLVDDDVPTFDPLTCTACVGVRDVFVHDRTTGQTTRVSVSSAGVAGNIGSTRPSISDDGNLVVFKSYATNLVDNDSNGADDVFIHELTTGQTTRVSVASTGAEANGKSSVPRLSADGRYVAYRSVATNLVAGFGNGFEQVYLVDRSTGLVTAVSAGVNGFAGNDNSTRPAVSSNGRFVAFHSDAASLISGDTNLSRDIFVRDLNSDSDGAREDSDNCPEQSNAAQLDGDGDGLGDVCDDDRDGDGTLNTADGCPDDADKTTAGACGCGAVDVDVDGDGAIDCIDACPDDPQKQAPGVCGCGVADVATANGIVCSDACPNDPDKAGPGVCGCGTPDEDSDGDGLMDCVDNCPSDSNADQADANSDGIGDVCDDQDDDGVVDADDNCMTIANADQDDLDADGLGDACDDDVDGDDVDDDEDNCPETANAGQSDADGDGVGDACDDDAPADDEPGATLPGGEGSSTLLCGALGMLGLPSMFIGLFGMRRRFPA